MRQLIAGVAAVGLSISGIVASAGSAQADVPCNITGFTPTTVIVGLSPVTRTFSVRTSGCTSQGWDLTLGNYAAFVFDSAPQQTFAYPHNSDAHSYSAVATAYNNDYDLRERSWPSAFHLLRADSWGSTVNAGPEPVRKGRAITIQGTLSRANWDNHKYQGHGFQPVQVQFRTPTGLYATVKTVKSTSNGSVKTTVTAQRTGFWRLVYRGNGASGPAKAAGDGVKVN